MSILYFTNIREEFTKNWNKYTISLMGWLTVVLENMCNCASYSISVTMVVVVVPISSLITFHGGKCDGGGGGGGAWCHITGLAVRRTKNRIAS